MKNLDVSDLIRVFGGSSSPLGAPPPPDVGAYWGIGNWPGPISGPIAPVPLPGISRGPIGDG